MPKRDCSIKAFLWPMLLLVALPALGIGAEACAAEAPVEPERKPANDAQAGGGKCRYSGPAKFAYGFSSNMVLQRGAPIRVWGWATKGATVVVAIGAQRATATADEYGKWAVELPEMQAGGPHLLSLSSDGVEVTLKNVMIGDVWLCAGQSNMRYGLNRTESKDADARLIFADELKALKG